MALHHHTTEGWRLPFYLCLGLLSACGSGVSEGPSGSLSLDLVLRNGAAIDEVSWQITGGD
ncbi:MAG: hypothetical protein WBG86_06100, partial [Polyangiales bacterium]